MMFLWKMVLMMFWLGDLFMGICIMAVILIVIDLFIGDGYE